MSSESEETTRAQTHPMRLVVERTGLSPHVLRVWERRYGAVHPTRSEGGQRLYTDANVVRLQLLQRAVRGGRNIGQLVHLPNEALQELIASDLEHSASAPVLAPEVEPSAEIESAVGVCLESVDRLDAVGLEATLRRATLLFSLPVVTDAILTPLLREIGLRWSEGHLGAAQEHVASGVVRRFLDEIVQSFKPAPRAPALVTGTLVGELHELGAMLAAAAAASLGWRVTHLGVDLPAAEIARAAHIAHASVVAISIVHPTNDTRLREELNSLLGALEPIHQLVLGGSGAADYADAVQPRGGCIVEDLAEFRHLLSRLAGDIQRSDLETRTHLRGA